MSVKNTERRIFFLNNLLHTVAIIAVVVGAAVVVVTIALHMGKEPVFLIKKF